MARESIFKKKERVRPPRVHITYEVETHGAIELKELPFVCGVVADLSGQPKEALPRLRDRKFVEIDRDNFDDVLRSMKPRLAFKVENKIENDGGQLSVELDFARLEDFRPEAVAKQVQPLNDLLEVRGKLRDLLSRTEGNDRLDEILNEIITKQGVQEKLKGVLGGSGEEPKVPAVGGSSPEEK